MRKICSSDRDYYYILDAKYSNAKNTRELLTKEDSCRNLIRHTRRGKIQRMECSISGLSGCIEPEECKFCLKKNEGGYVMALVNNKFTLEDLYIGMEIIDKDQLSSIYDTWIMLVKSNNSDVYTVGFIGKETNAESDKLFTQGNVVCPVYNDSMELEGDIYYEE